VHQPRLTRLSTRFPWGVDCIFHLRGAPYSLWTFLSPAPEGARVRLGCG